MSGSFSAPESYLISKSDVKFFLDTALPKAESNLKKLGIVISVYEGKHNAKAVFSIESFDMRLLSIGK